MPENQNKPRTKASDFIYAVGRRKTATARVRLFRRSGDLLVNGEPIGKYFPGEVARVTYLKPFEVTGSMGKYGFTVKTEGSGKAAQLGAVVHGIARALTKLDPDVYKAALKKAGLLTRDPRMKESRKVGTGGKARRRKQSPKR